MPQGRIPNQFTVLEEPKEEQSLTFSYFYSIISLKTFTDFLQPSFSDQLVQMIPQSSTILLNKINITIDARHNLLFNYCTLLFLVFLCKKVILGLGYLFPYF